MKINHLYESLRRQDKKLLEALTDDTLVIDDGDYIFDDSTGNILVTSDLIDYEQGQIKEVVFTDDNDDIIHKYKMIGLSDDGEYIIMEYIGTSDIDDNLDESLMNALTECLSRLTEGSISPEDQQDSDTIRGIISKLKNSKNADLSSEEKAVMKKYNIQNTNGNLTVANRALNPIITNNCGKGHNGDPEKTNFADRARKLGPRASTQIYDIHDNKYLNRHALWGRDNLQDVERVVANRKMREPVDIMKDALSSRKLTDRRLLIADKRRNTAISKAKAAYDDTVSRANKEYEVTAGIDKKYRDEVQDKIDTLLKRKSPESSPNESLSEDVDGIKSAEYIDYIMKTYQLSKSDLLDIVDNIGYFLKDNGVEDAYYDLSIISDYVEEHIEESLTEKYDEPEDMGKGYAVPLLKDSTWDVESYTKILNSDDKEWAKVARNQLKRMYKDMITNQEDFDEFNAYWTARYKKANSLFKSYFDSIPADIRKEIIGESIKESLSDALEMFLMDIAQRHGLFNYSDILHFKPDEDQLKRLKNLRAKYNREAKYEDDEAERTLELIARDIANLVKHKSTDESLKEAIDSDHIKWDENGEYKITGISKETLSFMQGVLGQLSDGYWENSSIMENYWRFAKIESGALILSWSPIYYASYKSSKWGQMSEAHIKDFFANKIKFLVKEELGPKSWSRDNESELSYLSGRVCDAYRAYDELKGRTAKKYGATKQEADVEESLKEALYRDMKSEVLSAVEDGFIDFEDVAREALRYLTDEEVKELIKFAGWSIADDEDFNESLTEKMEKGQEVTIRWHGPESLPHGYAETEYVGKTRDGKYKFESTNYGWIYLVDLDSNKVISPKGQEYEIDNSTGWLDTFVNESCDKSLEEDSDRKTFKCHVYNKAQKFHDIYLVTASTEDEAIENCRERLEGETDDPENYEIKDVVEE